jgi:hypothetical protein
MGSDRTDCASRPRVVILGGGFAGIGAARAPKDAEVVLLDKHDYHTFQPLLYQVATDVLEGSAVGMRWRPLPRPAERGRAPGDRDRGRPGEPVNGTEFDFRAARPIGATKLDNAFTDLERGPDGRARVTLHDPEAGRTVTLSADGHYGYPHALHRRPAARRQPPRLAVEPMTCPPNAFRTGDSVIRLAPSDSVTGAWASAAR